MIRLTRSQGIAAFDHIMDEVLGRPILKAALESEGIQDICALLTIDEETIDALSHSDEEGTTTVPLSRGDRNLIKVFLGYYRYRVTTGNPIEDWLSVELEDFNEFRLNPDVNRVGIPVPNGSGTVQGLSVPSTSTSSAPSTLLPIFFGVASSVTHHSSQS